MNEELRELAALAALGALEPDDLARLTEALEQSPELSRQLERDRDTVAALALIGDPVTAPDLGGRLVAAARRTIAEPSPRNRTRAPSRWRRFIPTTAVAVAAAAAAVAVTLVTTRDPGLGEPVLTAQVAPSDPAARMRGTAALFAPDRPDGLVVVDLDRMDPAPPGHHYEVWVLRDGASHMESVGTFAPASSGSVHLELRLPGGGTYDALDISIEDDGGAPEHSGTSVGGATFRSA